MTVEIKRPKWYGHKQKMKNIRNEYSNEVPPTEIKGRPKITWKNEIEEAMNCRR